MSEKVNSWAYNYERMWKELKEKLEQRADDEGMLSIADIEEITEDLENEYQKLI